MKRFVILCLAFFMQYCCQAQIKNAKTEDVNISGNCGMCKLNIEKAAKKKKSSQAVWNEKTKMATITYDSTKTNLNEILNRIALAGYDNPMFAAPDNAYAQLAGCCKYKRSGIPQKNEMVIELNNAVQEPKNEAVGVEAIYNAYFQLKDVLVKSDPQSAAANARLLSSAIQKTEIPSADLEVKKCWANLLASALKISESADLNQQRNEFISLSGAVYTLMKSVKTNIKVYYDFCPMANDNKGAYWLSKEPAIRNPYFGNMMLNCGSVKETIQP